MPNVLSRLAQWQNHVQGQLTTQYETLSKEDQQRVEIVSLVDSRSIILGDKRQALNVLAGGKYVVHVDDDDTLEDDFLPTLLEATVQDGDVITYAVRISIPRGEDIVCRYSLSYAGKQKPTGNNRKMFPDNRMAWKRTLALQARFPSILCGEDVAWAKQMMYLAKTEYDINKILYHYKYDPHSTLTQGVHRREDTTLLRTLDTILGSK